MKKNIGIIAIVALASVILALAFGAFINRGGRIQTKEAAKERYYCTACGEEVEAEGDGQMRPLAVIIENHPDARPQSGLEDACIVHEVVAEGGITRFLAVYLHKKSDSIGPVRSVRDYFAEMTKGYEAIISHCGGSPAGYQAIKDLKLDDLDEFANQGAYRRSSKRRRPHNLYTSTAELRLQAKVRKFDDVADFIPFDFKDDASFEERPLEMVAKINFSSPKFLVEYEYDRTSNSFLRNMDGKPHRDLGSGKQLKVKNILIQVTSIKVVDEVGRVKVTSTGRGLAYALLDGKVIEGKWVRNSLSDMIEFFDLNGERVELNRGQIWIETVSSKDMFSFEIEPSKRGD